MPNLTSVCGLKTVAYIHDLLPIEYPEYYQSGKSEYLTSFLSELAACRATFVANSRETAGRLESHARRMNWQIGQVPAIYPGIEVGSTADEAHPPSHDSSYDKDRPYFVVVGTIEPRKNHALLLQVWRELAQSGIEPTPHLYIVGSRGWDTDSVLDFIDRCEAIGPHVTEHYGPTDDELRSLIRGAHAVLFPSFAEGFGLPLVEALQLGTRVIASDLPVFREVAGDVPIYLSPLDGVGWKRAIVESLTEAQYANDPNAENLFKNFSWRRSSRELIEMIRKTGIRGETVS